MSAENMSEILRDLHAPRSNTGLPTDDPPEEPDYHNHTFIERTTYNPALETISTAEYTALSELTRRGLLDLRVTVIDEYRQCPRNCRPAESQAECEACRARTIKRMSGSENFYCFTCKANRDITPEWKCRFCNSGFVERSDQAHIPDIPVPAPPWTIPSYQNPSSLTNINPTPQFLAPLPHPSVPAGPALSQLHNAPSNFYSGNSPRAAGPSERMDRSSEIREAPRRGRRPVYPNFYQRARPSLLVDQDGNLIPSQNNQSIQMIPENSRTLYNIWQRVGNRRPNFNVNPNDIAWTEESLTNILDRLRVESESTERQNSGRNLSHLKETRDLPTDHKSCCICMSDFEEGETFIRLPCGHVFHAEEIRNWLQLNSQCPVCRKDAA